jgi:DNA-binding NtrC family response regulator
MQHGPPRTPLRPVLIIHDVMSQAMTLDLLCRSLGVETICTTSAAESGDILTRIRPAAIIAGLIMAGADELIMIATHAPAVPVMVVTGPETLRQTASEPGDTYGLDVVYVSRQLDIKTLRAFVDRAGLTSKPSQWDLH